MRRREAAKCQRSRRESRIRAVLLGWNTRREAEGKVALAAVLVPVAPNQNDWEFINRARRGLLPANDRRKPSKPYTPMKPVCMQIGRQTKLGALFCFCVFLCGGVIFQSLSNTGSRLDF